MKRKILLTLLLAGVMSCSLGAIACSDDNDGGNDNVPSDGKPSIIELNAYDIVVTQGSAYELFVTTAGVYSVSWASQDPTVATVSAEGVVTGVAVGETIITATIDSEVIEVRVTVSAQGSLTAAVYFRLSDSSSTIFRGASKQLATRMQVGDTMVDNYTVTYTSSDPSVATVNETGKVEAISLGTTIITATATLDGKTYTATSTITVDSVEVLELSTDTLHLSATGDRANVQVDASVYTVQSGDLAVDPNYAGTMAYTSSDPSVFTVNDEGVLTAVGVGEASLRVTTSDGLTANASVIVHEYYARIDTAYDFLAIADHMDGYFELANDIDFTNVTFTPIGLGESGDPTAATAFNGYLNGNGYAVKNVTHQKADARSIFTILGKSGLIENISFENLTLPNSRAARSAGLVWHNYGTINNVRLSVTTNGEGTSENDWGFGGIVSANKGPSQNGVGKITNCMIQLTSNASSFDYTGAILNVNQGGTVSGCVALVNNAKIGTYTHTGSFGSIIATTATTSVETAAVLAQDIDLNQLCWQVNAIGLPTLKNDGAVVEAISLVRLASETTDYALAADVTDVFYYTADGKQSLTIENSGSDQVLTASTLSAFADGINTLYMRSGSGDNAKLSILTYTKVTKYLATADDFKTLQSNSSGAAGYYILTSDIALGQYNLGASQITLSGTIDGNGHTITYSFGEAHDRSLMGEITATGVVKNLGVNVTYYDGNKVRVAAIAQTNNGLIENVYTYITFSVPAQEANNAVYSSGGIVMTNAGTINNCIAQVHYTGKTAINDCTLGICVTNDEGAVISNTALVAILDNESAGTLNAVGINKGETSNLLKFSSVADLYATEEEFSAYGFELGDYWTLTADAITFAPQVSA